jgi:hypothetical protein
MAVFNRVNGDVQLVNNVGHETEKNANSRVITTGIATPLHVLNIECSGNLAAELGSPNRSGVSSAVDTLLRTVAKNAVVLAYQTNPANTGTAADAGGASLTVLVERSGWLSNAFIGNTAHATITDLQADIRALGSNIGAYSAVDVSTADVREVHLAYRRP